jgi:hypothetical protein
VAKITLFEVQMDKVKLRGTIQRQMAVLSANIESWRIEWQLKRSHGTRALAKELFEVMGEQVDRSITVCLRLIWGATPKLWEAGYKKVGCPLHWWR